MEKKNHKENIFKKTVMLAKIKKTLLITLGFISLAFAIIGIFVVGLPTTPFLLLSASCFAKSSPKFYNWLISNKVFGKYISDYREGLGVPKKVKIVTLIFLWVTISISIFFLNNLHIRITLIIIAVLVSIHIILIKNKH